MTRSLIAALLLAWPTVTLGQSIIIETTPLDDGIGFETYTAPNTIQEEPRETGETGQGAVLRALDKVSGLTRDIELTAGDTQNVFDLTVSLSECRFPTGNPAGDAYAYLVIRDLRSSEARFTGWMIASSPALSALDHPRYDVWVLRCITS